MIYGSARGPSRDEIQAKLYLMPANQSIPSKSADLGAWRSQPAWSGTVHYHHKKIGQGPRNAPNGLGTRRAGEERSSASNPRKKSDVAS